MKNMLYLKEKFTISLFILFIMLIFLACENEESNKNLEVAREVTPYSLDITELNPRIYPDDYPLISFNDFEAAFEKLKEANINGKLDTYMDIVNIFGPDGAYYKNCDKDYQGTRYKYYGWYADNGVSILITFKVKGNQLKYYAYTTNGII